MAACLIAVLACAPAQLQARDEIEYGRYLGTRLRMYDEAHKLLDEVIEQASGARESAARQAKADVYKAKADNDYAEDANMTARMDLYESAIEVFGDPKEDPVAVAAKGTLLLGLARDVTRFDAARARGYVSDAIELLDAERQRLLNLQRVNNNAFRLVYAAFSKVYYQYCNAFIVRARTYPAESDEREGNLREARREIDEFQFALDDATEELVLSFELMGEIELARGDAVAAVGAFIEVAGFVSNYPANSYVGRLAIQHGYLRAAELLTTELDYDAANLERVLQLYQEAFSAYGKFSELDVWFKRLQLHRISAQIKLGEAVQVRAAIDLLFKLAADSDPQFRRQAVTVLADVGTRPELDDELVFRCAEIVYAEMAASPVVNVMLKNVQAYQLLLVRATDVQKFETYAPTAFMRIGETYAGMWRWMDAALVFREATYRTGYFREKFAETAEIPAHMRGRCPLIREAGDLQKFPGEMADRASRNARFLVHAEYGDPANREFQRLSNAMEQLKAEFGGEAALFDLSFRTAGQLVRDKQHARGAVRYLRLPARYRNSHIATYVAARSYYLLSVDAMAPRISRSGPDEERESDAFFSEQRARHATDLADLPESMWKGLEVRHWDAIMNAQTPDALANWHKAVYYYKKYFLLEARRSWQDIQPLLAEVEAPTVLDGIHAVAEFRNARWLSQNPQGSGDPDADMRRMGFAGYELAYLLRNPPQVMPEAAREKLKGDSRDFALGVLRRYWSMYGYHLADNADYQRQALSMSFSALIEANNVDASEQVFLTYQETFPDNESAIRSMIRRLRNLMAREFTPRVDGMRRISDRLSSLSSQLKRNLFERIDPNGYPEDAAKLAEAKGHFERRKVLAEHFWTVWVLSHALEDERVQAGIAHLPELKADLTSRWQEYSEQYPARWARAVEGEIRKQVADRAYQPIRESVTKLLEGERMTLLDRLLLLRDSEEVSDSDRQLLVQLTTGVQLATDELAWFTGAVFIYDWGAVLEEAARGVDAQARPVTSRVLRYIELDQGDQGMTGMSDGALLSLGEMHFVIGNWSHAARYLDALAERVKGTWGKIEEISVDTRPDERVAGRPSSGQELQVRYMLGKSYLELFKQSGEQDQLVRAALELRRCWCFNLLRDTNTRLEGRSFRLAFQNEIELYYLAGAAALSEAFLLLHRQDDVSIEWPKYVSQTTSTLEPRKDESGEVVLQRVPTNKAAYLWESSRIRLQVWASFTQLSAYQYRQEFRDNLTGWLDLMIVWVETYGKEDTGAVPVPELEQLVQDAYNRAMVEGSLDSTYLGESTKQYLAGLVERAGKLAAAAKKAEIRIEERPASAPPSNRSSSND